jgi:hypothetical protein
MGYAERRMDKMANVNYDEGTIKLGNEWYAVEGLKNKITDMLAVGNCKINNYARVLEELDTKMEGTEPISAVLTAKTLDGLNKIVSESSKSMGDCVREALTAYLRS